jgi:hypothetical protein
MERDTVFEDRVIAVLEAGPQTNKGLRVALKLPVDNHHDVLDRTLQRLKKKGILVYEDRCWRSTNMSTCPCCFGHGLVSNAQKENFNRRMAKK